MSSIWLTPCRVIYIPIGTRFICFEVHIRYCESMLDASGGIEGDIKEGGGGDSVEFHHALVVKHPAASFGLMLERVWLLAKVLFLNSAGSCWKCIMLQGCCPDVFGEKQLILHCHHCPTWCRYLYGYLKVTGEVGNPLVTPSFGNMEVRSLSQPLDFSELWRSLLTPPLCCGCVNIRARIYMARGLTGCEV